MALKKDKGSSDSGGRKTMQYSMETKKEIQKLCGMWDTLEMFINKHHNDQTEQ